MQVSSPYVSHSGRMLRPVAVLKHMYHSVPRAALLKAPQRHPKHYK